MQQDRTHQLAQEIQALVDEGPSPAALNQAMAQGPGPDAATFTDGTDSTPVGLLIGWDYLTVVKIPADQTQLASMRRKLVGDPGIDRFSILRAVDFWVGDTSVSTKKPSVRATTVLHDLLDDIASGDYAASDQERDHAQAVLGVDQVIFGPCLVLGRDNSTGDSTGLPEAFLNWLEHKIADEEERNLEILANWALAAAGITVPSGAVVHLIQLD